MPYEPSSTPGAVWIVPVMVLTMVLGATLPHLVEWLWSKRRPRPYRKRRLPR